MGKRILSVSYIEDSYQYLEIDKQAGGMFPQPSPPTATVESLLAACRKADEIYISAGLPTALYEWEAFPKVAKRYTANLVQQDAKEKSGSPGPLRFQYKELGDVTEGGATKTKIAYIAVQEDDLKPLWTTFGKFMRKVKFISPLPVALASTVAKADKPSGNFVVVWVGDTTSVITISSPDGMVKMARSVPVGLAKGSAGDAELYRALSDELGKEIFMTSNFFKQEFREGVPQILYILGNSKLEGIFRDFPLAGAPAETHFQLSEAPVKGVSLQQANEAIHLIGNLFLPSEFSFLPSEVEVGRKGDTGFTVAAAVLALIIAGVAFWGFQLYTGKQEAQAKYMGLVGELQQLQKDVSVMRADVDKLKPFEGWKTFYEETFQSRPAWNMLLSELALRLPENILIEDVRFAPTSDRRAVTTDILADMAGKIKADNWQAGLDELRAFGRSLQESSVFNVADVKYSPQNLENQTKVFDFKITLKLLPRGSANES